MIIHATLPATEFFFSEEITISWCGSILMLNTCPESQGHDFKVQCEEIMSSSFHGEEPVVVFVSSSDISQMCAGVEDQ